MSEDTARQLAERRLRQFERALHATAATMGEPDPQGIVRSALDLAAHAALPVAFDPGLLHLLRINFFFDRERVPHWVEARLLLSTLCRDAEGNGLYMMDAPVRELLLVRLLAHHGQDRLHAVATLLWQYTERRTAWAERSELRHAQQLTALNFLAPERAQAWLDAAEHGSGPANLSKDWFLAMRGAMPELPPARRDGNPAMVCKALRQLDFAAQRAAHRETLSRSGPGPELLLIRGPRDHGHRWLLLRLLRHFERAPGLVWLGSDVADRQPLMATLALTLGLDAEAPWPRIRERAEFLARTRPLAIALDGTERLNETQRGELQELLAAELPASLYLIDRAEGIESAVVEAVLASVSLLTRSATALPLPALGRMSHEDVRDWVDRHAGEAGLDGLEPEETRDATRIAEEVLKATGGVPERVLEHLCVRCGVRWPEVLAIAAAPFALQLPPPDDAIAELAAEYERRRGEMLPGPARTGVMEDVVRRMRERLNAREDWPLRQWSESASVGLRLAAAVLLQLRPQAGHCEWLGSRVREEKPFVAYQAMLALLHAAKHLPLDELQAVDAAVVRATADLGPTQGGTDRAAVLRNARKVLDERRLAGAPVLPLVPLPGVVVFPGREVQVAIRSEWVMRLAKAHSGDDERVFAVLDESTGKASDPRVMRRIGTIATVTRIETTKSGPHVTLSGIGRAKGTPLKEQAGRDMVLARVDPLPDTEDRLVRPGARTALIETLQALVRLGGAGGKIVDVARSGPLAAACYELAEMLSLAPAQRQKLLEADHADAMLDQLTASAMARIEDGLPQDFGGDGWGFYRLGASLAATFADSELGELFETRIPAAADNPGVIAALVRSAAAGGRLRAIVSRALARRPGDNALWEHVEAMTQRPEHPQATPKQSARPARAVALKLWPNGSTLRIAFLHGDAKLRQRVMRFAAQWFDFANLRYEVLPRVGSKAADIRIAFQRDEGSWSYVGTDARSVAADQPTMNFGWLDHDTPEPEFQRVVLKEFGHALGLWQEHKNPKNGIDWDREAVMKYFGGPPNHWSQQLVEQNVLTPNPPSRPPYRPFDPQSVMLYDFPAEILRSHQPIHGGRTLSDSDKAFIAALYPHHSAIVRPPRTTPARKKS